MIDKITLDQLEGYLAFFYKMYDVVRLVDPVEKIVVEYRENKRAVTSQVCHEYWKEKQICDNCISIRAHFENKCFMKLEQAPETIMMVTALPIEHAQHPAVLELLKNASDTMMIGTGNYTESQLMKNVVVEINDLIMKDELTGLYNRRYVDERLPADVVKASMSDTPLSLAFLDVDDLKGVNDTYGHTAGDQVITKVASVLMGCIRSKTDWAARYGGDEFLICLNNTGYEDACHVMERICEQINVELGDGRIISSVSVGIYTMHGSRLTPGELIALADKRMYEAKTKTGHADKLS